MEACCADLREEYLDWSGNFKGARDWTTHHWTKEGVIAHAKDRGTKNAQSIHMYQDINPLATLKALSFPFPS